MRPLRTAPPETGESSEPEPVDKGESSAPRASVSDRVLEARRRELRTGAKLTAPKMSKK